MVRASPLGLIGCWLAACWLAAQAPEVDAAVRDAAALDGAALDAAAVDAPPPDAANVDAALPDAALPDAALPDAALPDAPPVLDTPLDGSPDAPLVAITRVPCAGATIAVTVFTAHTSFTPDQPTIHAGEVVRFEPTNPHDVVAGTPASPETWFQVDGNTVGCYRFDAIGAFRFFCSLHPPMTGTITVGP